MRPSGWIAMVDRILLAQYIVFGASYDQGRFDPNRAWTRRRYLTSCASLPVGRKWMRGCQDFSRSTAFDKTGRRMGAREGIC